MKVFLSASVPLPTRDPVFMETADVCAIREAIKSMVLVLLERNGTLVFGGHPAITPLVRLLFHEADVSPRQHVTLYQSRFFVNDFPPENEAFERIVIVDAVANDREQSLFEMRRRMITETDYTCAVFIGGMEGVIEEFKLFRELQPGIRLLPVASTGAASLNLYEGYGIDTPELKSELTYPTLFRNVLV
ncbi:MAG: hypothetical protein OXC91_13425 [Rhodobacteraceae bacterium]|nr:hypothetical protein [Paracoccaceae bacterium]